MSVIIKNKKIKDIPVLHVNGRLINVDSEKFLKKLDSFCKKHPPKCVIDISEVAFIDSFGLGSLVQHYTQMKKVGCSLYILNTNNNPNAYVKRLFDMTGLDQVFPIIESIDQVN